MGVFFFYEIIKWWGQVRVECEKCPVFLKSKYKAKTLDFALDKCYNILAQCVLRV